MMKKMGLAIMGVLFLGLYALLSLLLFAGENGAIYYLRDGLAFGSMTLLGSFVAMTVILLVLGDALLSKLSQRGQKG